MEVRAEAGAARRARPADIVADGDIDADVDRTHGSAARHWFVDCKHYDRGVPPEALQGLLTWAQSERPHVALAIVSGFLSNAAKDHLEDYERNNRPPFRIKYWERPMLEKLVRESEPSDHANVRGN